MQNFKAIKGNPDYEHLEIDATMDDNGNVVDIYRVKLFMLGEVCIIELEHNYSFHNALITFVESEYKRIKKYRKLESLFLEVLRDTIIIENEEAYNYALKEYNSRTKDMNDDGMHDLNGDKNSF